MADVKKSFERPDFEVVVLKVADVVATSIPDPDDWETEDMPVT